MKRKSLNPVAIILGRQFSEVSEEAIFVIVTKTSTSILMERVESLKELCVMVPTLPEDLEITIYVKQPFTKTFVSGTKIFNSAMAHYFPKEEVVETTEEVDEVETETVEVVEVVEVPKKKSKKSKAPEVPENMESIDEALEKL